MKNEEFHHRIKNAIILLEEGHPYKVGELILHCQNSNQISITGWSQKTNIKYLTIENAQNELKEIKEVFTRMSLDSVQLFDFLKGRELEYYLCFDDYGKAGIEICSEINGITEWKILLKE